MNNPRSVAMGWVAILAVGGVSFYYAKKGIEQKRKAYRRKPTPQATEIKDWYQRIDNSNASTNTSGKL